MSTTKDKATSSRMGIGELFQGGVYKRNQGRITRQVTFGALAILFVLMAWRFYRQFAGSFSSTGVAYGIAGAILVVGLWVSFRIVNMPRFADFLISVEAEMNKVSWPSWGELVRSSIVVIVVIFLLAGVLFGFDIFWRFMFQWLGVLRGESS